MGETDTSWVETALFVLFLIVLLVVVGWLSGRILGVRRGLGRAVLSGLIGFAAGWILVLVQFGDRELEDPADILGLGAGFLGYVLIVTLVASVVIDALFRPRGGRRGLRIPRPIQALRRRLAVLSRVRQIAAAARRNGLVGRQLASPAGLSSPEGARALRLTLEESGGMLVKFGQIASTREDLLPPVVIDELSELRGSVPGLPFEVIRTVVESELRAPLGEVFAEFSPEPLAAASIGVTHRAVLRDGRHVIVKVQRPGIQESIDRDGRVLVWAAEQLERRSDSARQMGMADLARELVSGVKEELDFTNEANNNRQLRAARGRDTGIAFPEIFAEFTTRRVLVMEEVDGRSVADEAAVAATGVPPEVLAGHLLDAFLGQVLQDGVYHADPHPGNVLVTPDGMLWLIDYGAVGHLDPVTLEGLQQMAMGFTLRDPSILARGVRRIAGAKGEELDIASLEFDVGVVLTDVQGGGFDPEAISEIVRVLNRHGVGAPRALTVLARASITLDGTLRLIDPGFRMGPAAQERMGRIVNESQLAPREQLIHEAARALPALRSLPQLGEDLAFQARAGRLTLRVDRFEGGDGRRIERWINQILFTVIGVVGLIASALLFIAAGLTANESVAVYLRVIAFVGIILAAAMQLRVVAQVLRRRDPDDPF